jgi:DNA-binding NarL/FixJ family response regulator
MASGDIAGELGLSDGTVRNYLSEAISKLGAGNRVEAARIARTKDGCKPNVASSHFLLQSWPILA